MNDLANVNLLIILFSALVHLVFACAVFADAQFLWREHRRKTFLVGGVVWALATLLGGVVTVLAYWFVHHSSLRPISEQDAAQKRATDDPK